MPTIINNPDNLSPEDQAIWEEYIQDIRIAEQGEPKTEEENFAQLLDANENKRKNDAISITEKNVPIKAHTENTSPSSGLDKRTLQKLKKGKIPIEGKIDLHGLNQAQAYEKLHDFILQSYNKNLRCVLVITGKGKSGTTSEDWLKPSTGVLKEKTPLWLLSPALKNIVLKFSPAQAKDGGSGALYVYLRRQKR